MKFVILIHSNPQPWGHPTGDFNAQFQKLSAEERQRMDAEFDALLAELTSSGELVTGEALADPAAAAIYRWHDGAPIKTDGPYAGVQGAVRRVLHDRRCRPGASRSNRGPVRDTGRHDRAATCNVARRRRPVSDRVSEDVWRTEGPHVLAALLRRNSDVAACEDAVQDALLAATQQWAAEGVPAEPRGWLIRVASRRLIDRQRSDGARRQREQRVAVDPLANSLSTAVIDDPGGRADSDDTLHRLVLCAHPALSPASQVALTLRVVAGLTTAQIAAAFHVPEATMAQRVVRAKATIADYDVRLPEPHRDDLPARIGAVHTIAPSTVVSLNLAVAIGMADGADAGLAALRPLLDGSGEERNHRVHSAHAHLLELAGDPTAASAAYRRAAALTASTPEQRYLNRRATDVTRSLCSPARTGPP